MSLIDTHCHLTYDFAPKTVDDLVRQAREAGVDALVSIATDAASIPLVRALSESHPEVFHTAGVHPHEAAKLRDEELELIRSALTHPRCVAVGEIGLDYHYDFSPRETQLQRLDQQLEIALEAGKPVVIHNRESEGDMLDALRRYAKRVPSDHIPGIIHCFTGPRSFGQACLELGFLISFSGILTFKNAEEIRSCAREFPLDRILVETDAPYLAPAPYRGKKCEPAMVRQVALRLAEERRISLDEVAVATSANARRVYGL